MKEIVIFGVGKIAEVVHYYFENESEYKVAAFTADREYVKSDSFLGLPAIPFDELEGKYPASEFDMFVAVGYHDLNRLRSKKIDEVKSKGYLLVSCVHKDSAPADLKYGKNCFIMKGANIHPHVELGDDVFVWSGAMIGHHSKIGNHNWLTSAANIGGNVEMGDYCFLAMNATISHSIKIGNKVFLGANALVTKDLEEGKVVIAQNDKPIKLNSDQFLRMSGFTSL